MKTKGESKGYRYLSILVCVFLLSAIGMEATAGAEEKFPTSSITLIIPAPPGGGGDILGRLIAEATEPILGQKLVVINKPGAAGTIGVSEIVRAKKDGYTIGNIWNGPLTMIPHTRKVTYTIDDLNYITQLSEESGLFCVLSEFPTKTAKEFFDYTRKNPGKLTYSNDGIGGQMQLMGERIFQAMGVKLRPVPYDGAGEAIKALLGRQVDVYSGPVSTALPYIKEGSVRPIFVTTSERARQLPDVVGVSDLGHPETATGIWQGIIGPKGIPKDRLDILEKAFRQALQPERVRDYFEKRGMTPVGSSGKQFEEHTRSESAAIKIVAEKLGLAPK